MNAEHCIVVGDKIVLTLRLDYTQYHDIDHLLGPDSTRTRHWISSVPSPTSMTGVVTGNSRLRAANSAIANHSRLASIVVLLEQNSFRSSPVCTHRCCKQATEPALPPCANCVAWPRAYNCCPLRSFQVLLAEYWNSFTRYHSYYQPPTVHWLIARTSTIIME